jgi:hypothetical protein
MSDEVLPTGWVKKFDPKKVLSFQKRPARTNLAVPSPAISLSCLPIYCE